MLTCARRMRPSAGAAGSAMEEGLREQGAGAPLPGKPALRIRAVLPCHSILTKVTPA